jgi:hypothetical protein
MEKGIGYMRNCNSLIITAIYIYLLNALFSGGMAIGAPVEKRGPVEITKVGLDKKSFNPSKKEKVVLSFEISRQADVQVFIYDRLGEQVQSFDMPDLESGRHSITWDGRGTNGKLAIGDVFLYVIKTETKDGGKAIYNKAGQSGGIKVKSLEYTLDRETGKIEYVLPGACMIRIRAGLKDSVFGHSLFDWKPSTAGRHSFIWNGRDESGMMNLLRHHDLDLRLACYTLPGNTIIATGQTVPFESDRNPGRTMSKERQRIWATKGKYLHYQHDPRICHQPRFKVLFPTGTRAEAGDVPIVSGIVPIRIELDPRDEQHLINTRFEIMLFVNGVFIYEIEEGSSPFTFNWDTKSFAKGPHIVTVNLAGYDDHIGIVSSKVIVGE